MSLEYNSLEKTEVMSHRIAGYCYKTQILNQKKKFIKLLNDAD